MKLILSVWVTGKYFGASTTFVRSVGLIEKLFSAGRVAGMEYFVKETPKIDWQWMFVVEIFIGSLISSAASNTFRWQAVPNMWERQFGPSRILRGLVAFLGGLIAMFQSLRCGNCHKAQQ